MSAFDLYWRVLGLPLSCAKGVVVDAIPFSVVEVSLWTGAAATLALAASFLFRRGAAAEFLRRRRLVLLLLGPMFLTLLGLGQGAFPGSIAPTARRQPLADRLSPDTLDEASFRAWAARREARLRAALENPAAWNAFQAYDEHEALRVCDRALDTVLAALGLPPGRTVRTFKTMGPWTTTLGLVYGGPAFHDPFFGEIAIVSDADLPASHFWRLTAACHEAAHAKGFTREMDAEILTQLALADHADPRLRLLGDIHFLRKTGLSVAWPDSLIAEGRRMKAAREALEARQPVVNRLRDWAQGAGLRNSAAKYGARDRAESWNPRHPFFATVRTAEARGRDGDGDGHGGDIDDSSSEETPHGP